MLPRLFVCMGLIAAAGCTSQVQPRLQIGSPTPEATAQAESYCPGSTFESIDPANPPDEWFKC